MIFHTFDLTEDCCRSRTSPHILTQLSVNSIVTYSNWSQMMYMLSNELHAQWKQENTFGIMIITTKHMKHTFYLKEMQCVSQNNIENTDLKKKEMWENSTHNPQ